jgi:hypothetical protein
VDLVTITSDHFRDYPFASGPTDWFAAKGTWDLTTRWPCELSWTFLGGVGSDNPVLWSKHNYRGDIVLEFFAGLQAQPEYPRYPRPGDINATICGDGRSLGSGYSFVLAGWNNSRSAILRNGEIVAETPDVVFANTEPVRGDGMAFHRGWSRVRAEKLGNRVRFWVDGRPILEYTDPDPLPGGRVALWSFYNGLMLGRARLWYAEEEPGGVVRVPEPRPNTLTPMARKSGTPAILNDFETDAGEWRSASAAPGTLLELDAETAVDGGRSLRVTNEREGGPFSVYAVTTPFRVADWPVLSFHYRLTPDVKLNLYFYIYGQWHVLEFTAEQFPRDGMPVIGGVPDVQADGEWHHAEVNLLEPLREMYPHLEVFAVQYVSVSPPWESYVRCGIGGNGRGAQYWIDNFRIGPPP